MALRWLGERRYFIGLMSGTSLDGVDGVLSDFSGERPRVMADASVGFDGAFRAELLALNRPGPDELHRSAQAADRLVRHYAQVVRRLLEQTGLAAQDVAAIGAHGQTVRHQPPGSRRAATAAVDEAPYTIQINAPATLAELTGISVVADFRSRDIAAGGQGAPLVPAFHKAMFGHKEASVVVNLGGMANATWLGPQGEVAGLDTGPGNVLLDMWCERHTGASFDRDGAWAARGCARSDLLQALWAEPYFSQTGHKSTGRDLFHWDWLSSMLAPFANTPPQDVQATLVELTALSVVSSVRDLIGGTSAPSALVLCGGGAYNPVLVSAIRAQALKTWPGCEVQISNALGWPAHLVEAAAFAWLASQALGGLPANEPAVTGATGPRLLGAIYPA